MTSTTPKVFLSYAREDAETANFLFRALRDKGIDIWLDSNSLRIGDTFEAKIEDVIANSDFALVCLSSKSVNKTGFVQREFRIILEASKTRPFEVPFALPIKLDRCEIPREFARYHWVDLPADGWESFIDKLARDIHEHYGNLMSRQSHLDKAVAEKHTINVNVTLQPIYTPGTEDKLAAVLLDRLRPGTAIGEKVKEWASAYIRDSQFDLFQDYETQRQILQDYLKKRLLDEIGLNFQIKLSLEGEESLEPIPLGPLQFSVRLKDYAQTQDLRLETGLRIETALTVDEQNKINAVLYQSTELTRGLEGMLTQLIKERVQTYFARNVTLGSFHTELQTDSLQQDLIKELNDALKSVGRKIDYITLKGVFATPSYFETQQGVAIYLSQYPDPIILHSKVQLALRDNNAYLMAQTPELDVWFEKMLQRVIHTALFGASYTDLLLRFEPLEKQIKETLKAETAKIGYDLKQLIIIPELEPLNWLKHISIEVEDSFETRLAGFNVSLSLFIVAKIRSLRDVEIYLNQGQDVPELMREAALGVTRQYLHGIEPERFYMRFYYSDEEHPDEFPVEKELIERITEVLEEKFHADVSKVILKVGRDEVISRMQVLQRVGSSFEFEVKPLRGGEPVHFSGIFRVRAIDSKGWSRFHRRKFDIKDVRGHLENHLRVTLRTLSTEELAYKELGSLRKLMNLIGDMANQCVREEFGLVISVDMVDRELTTLEMEMNKEFIERDLSLLNTAAVRQIQESGKSADIATDSAKLDELERLYQLKTELLRTEASQDEVKEMEEKIAEMRVEFLSGLDLSISTDIQLQINPQEDEK